MPEYPDITVYISALERRILGKALKGFSLRSPFLLRTVIPRLDDFVGARATALARLGKRIVISFRPPAATHGGAPENNLWMVFHLMIAGRLHWKGPADKPPGKNALVMLEFENGLLYLTEAGSKKRASLQLFDRAEAVQGVNPGGLEVMEADFDAFRGAFTAANHTLKRALTDPKILSGIGNAYSDEILHRARLSPVATTHKLTAGELRGLYEAIRNVLGEWTQRLGHLYGEGFPEKVTAFREGMAVHGRYGLPCPDCTSPVQRIRYATNETNYCATCQTGGRILADRALSRLLKRDWPRSFEELEKRKKGWMEP